MVPGGIIPVIKPIVCDVFLQLRSSCQHLLDAAAVVRFLLFKEPAFVDKTYSTAAWAGNKTAYS